MNQTAKVVPYKSLILMTVINKIEDLLVNYLSIYNSLIKRAINRSLNEYVESHHIIPRCMGGSNEKNNLVDLTPEEHYIAHLLLVKIYPMHPKLLYAANMMANRNNKKYGWLRRKFVEQLRKDRVGFKHGAEAKRKIQAIHLGVKKTDEWKKKASVAKMLKIEYNGIIYYGYDDLKEKTGITRHLYLKFYKNNIDPTPFINNKSHGLVQRAKTNPSQNAKGKIWYNNGSEEKYMEYCPEGWYKGRLKYKRDKKGRYLKNGNNI